MAFTFPETNLSTPPEKGSSVFKQKVQPPAHSFSAYACRLATAPGPWYFDGPWNSMTLPNGSCSPR